MTMASAELFSLIFLSALTLNILLHVWLALRHLHHVAAHRDHVPEAFAAHIALAQHQKAADYSQAKTRVGLAEFAAGVLLLLALTYGGLLQQFYAYLTRWFPADGYALGLALFASLAVASFVVDLPFGLYRTFVLEARFGFNKMSPPLFLADLAKQILLGVAIGAPVLLAVLWLMAAMGRYWWFYVWLFWLGCNLLALLIYPTLIAPLFNKFSQLDDAELRARIEALLARCGFRSKGLMVMDGSRRSAHGNAYFTGFGAAKRIVFFDTLLAHLGAAEVEAVLAHELGHYRHHHVWQRVGLLAVFSLAALYLLGVLIEQPWFYAGLGVSAHGTAVALILFSLTLPVFTFLVSPLLSYISRRHEYQADAYAAKQASAGDLISALVKLYRDNAATLTPDPLHSLFYDSHPPAALRIAQLQRD